MELQILWSDGCEVMELPYHHESNHYSTNQTLAPDCSLRYWQEARSASLGDLRIVDDIYWQEEVRENHRNSLWPEEVRGNNRNFVWPEESKVSNRSCVSQEEIKGSNRDSVWQNELKENSRKSVWLEEVKGNNRKSVWQQDEKGNEKGNEYGSSSSGSDGKVGSMATAHRKRKFWEQHIGVGEQEKESGEQGEDPKESRDAAKKHNPGSPVDRTSNSWDLAENLAADLDGSLSGLGVDLSTASYNMSEALLALPSLAALKQEAPSPNSHNDNGLAGVREADSNTPSFANALQRASSQHGGSTTSLPQHGGSATSLHQLLQAGGGGGYSSNNNNNNNNNNNAVTSTAACEAYQQQRPTKMAAASSTTTPQDLGIDCRFQYVLAAATSIATKVNEETLTYLNQGQSYEIKLKKLGELSAYRGKILKSVIRICFHERRLQYMEAEQMTAWRASRPGDRIVEVDIPLSYGIYDVFQDQWMLNTVEFLWDPTKEVGVYIKVNCISTEFTPKKHGGEKGVPFRIQVETYLQGEGAVARLHCGACQIKVFKLKGGDRKHKQDREKIQKRPPTEPDKYQPSYDCTVLNDVPSEMLYPSQMNPAVSSSQPVYSPPDNRVVGKCVSAAPPSSTTNPAVSVPLPLAKEERSLPPQLPPSPDPVACPLPADQHSLSSQDLQVGSGGGAEGLASDATSQQTGQWLQANRFSSYLRVFSSFSGADILRLTRDDLIQICGLPDGIRLFNSLHSRSMVPLLTLYLCVEHAVYHALYLGSASSLELTNKLAALLGVPTNQIHDVYLQGPAGIHVLLSDDVLRNLKDEAMFTIEVLQDQMGEMYRLLLKPNAAQ